jgi:Capsule polysaccharide biosynthesis protein
MDSRSPQSLNEGVLADMRLLALLPLSRKDRTKYIFELLAAAKARWNWNIDVVCQVTDRRPFENLVSPGGGLYSPPHLLKVADWERDPIAAAALARRVHEGEMAADLPLGRMVLGGAHSVGRAFNLSLRYSNRYPLVQRMSRHNLEPFLVYHRLFKFCDDTIDSANPDLIFSLDWTTPLNSCMWLAANLRGVPCVAIRNSKIVPNHAFWTTDRLLLNTAALDRSREKRDSKAPVSEAARKYIEGFRNQPRTIDYIASKWRDRMRRGFWRWHLEYARTMVRELINTTRGQDRALRERGIVRLYRYYRGLFLAYRHRNLLTALSEDTLAKTKYVYFPMHKEAELAQTFQATLWHDQRNTIRVLASLLPAGYRLLVREHRLNYGLRPTRVYRQLSTIPNVVLIDPFDSQFKYLRHADLIITENGSSGWEGLVLGRPVITLSRTFYDGAGLGSKIENPEKLNAAILEALAKPAIADPRAHDDALACMVDAELESTFPTNKEGVAAALDLLMKTVDSVAQSPRPAASSLMRTSG